MSRPRSNRSERRYSFPRVSGDEPQIEDVVCGQLTFSPRERG